MRKTIIGAAIMVAMGVGLSIGSQGIVRNTNAIDTSQVEEQVSTSDGAVVEDLEKETLQESSETDETASTDTTEAASTEVADATEETTEVAADCQYPQWADYVVANVEGSVRVRQEPNTDSEIVGKFYDKAVGQVVEQADGWTKITSGNVTGYVSNDYLMFGDEAGAYIEENYKNCATATTDSLNVRAEQSTSADILGKVNSGDSYAILSETDEWVQIQYTNDSVGYLAKEYVTEGWNYATALTVEEEQAQIQAEKEKEEAEAAAAAANSSSSSTGTGSQTVPAVSTSAEGLALGQEIASYACQFVGNPYVYGGSSLTDGTDCSGFTMAVYAQFGYSLSHGSYTQMQQGTAVPLSDVQPGDIICYGGHVGLYIGNGQIVHAATESQGIIISSMYTLTPIGARRIVQ